MSLPDEETMRIAHDSGDELPTSVRIPEQRHQEIERHHREAIAALDAVAPQAVRIANASRITDLHLLIADAVTALEHDEPELALRILRGARADVMPKRGRARRSWT